jgi:leucyl aminopeptidase
MAMADRFKLEIKAAAGRHSGDVVAFVEEAAPAKPAGLTLDKATAAALQRAATIETFKAKLKSALTIVAGEASGLERLTLIGLGPEADRAKVDHVMLGGSVYGKLPKGRAASIMMDTPGGAPTPDQIADFALGMRLRAYSFDRYKSKKKDDDKDEGAGPSAITLLVADVAAVKKAMKSRDAVSEGVNIARDLVNEPPNVLTPSEFAKRAQALEKLGVEVEVLGEKELKKIGMRALLGVGQGSEQESKVVIMRWNGGKASQQPVAIVGKGVVFDTGGISIKPAGGMEDMKGDMAGAACVVGLMHTLAARKAKANVVGAIGLVENMPDGKAQRPGDIVTSLSGQTIEIINTDAEGRLVLADVLWHINQQVKPRWMVNLATLTGAILVALAHEHAGMFANDDALAARLDAAGKATGEKVWRMPLGPEYDKMIDSKFADMKNSAGRYGGSITAAQFLKRYVGETPWAHLDIAGTGMGSPQNDINKSWGCGWGVRLLDKAIADEIG